MIYPSRLKKSLWRSFVCLRKAKGYETGSTRMFSNATKDRSAAEAAYDIKKAAMYVRMSTDHQKYSTENQEHAIRE
ncbi:MAG: hypothetical protein CL570_06185 [Alphaproteobacteria bacterium]|nr:hypothetical protein [Alphaproteobacteria bacterium]